MFLLFASDIYGTRQNSCLALKANSSLAFLKWDVSAKNLLRLLYTTTFAVTETCKQSNPQLVFFRGNFSKTHFLFQSFVSLKISSIEMTDTMSKLIWINQIYFTFGLQDVFISASLYNSFASWISKILKHATTPQKLK